MQATTLQTTSLRIEVAPGELLDRITILEIKAARISDPGKLRNVRREMDELRAVAERGVPDSPGLRALRRELKAVNETLWEVEDAIRLCERRQDFGPAFIRLARSVYEQNDRRAALKRQINELLQSRLVEEKSYTDYAKRET